MAKFMKRLSSLDVRRKGIGTHPDGRGLYLQVAANSRSWLFRFTLNGRARWAGLGPVYDVSLAEACKGKQISRVTFDRSGYRFHGRVKAIADGAREGGLDF